MRPPCLWPPKSEQLIFQVDLCAYWKDIPLMWMDRIMSKTKCCIKWKPDRLVQYCLIRVDNRQHHHTTYQLIHIKPPSRWDTSQSWDNELAGWCSRLQQHTNSYQLVEKGVIAFRSHACTDRVSLQKTMFSCLAFMSNAEDKSPSCSSSPCRLSRGPKSRLTAPTYTEATIQTNTFSCLPLCDSSADSMVRSWGGYMVSRAADQQPRIYTHWLTACLTEWVAGSLDDWMTDYKSAGGSRVERHSPLQPADLLPGWRDGWMTRLMGVSSSCCLCG